MALCKFLKGDSARISTDVTPFHEGYIYVTNDGYMYIDMNLGTADAPNNQRVKLNAGDAETVLGASLSEVLNSSDEEIPTSKAVLDALQSYVEGVLKYTVQTLTDDQKVQARTNIGAEASGAAAAALEEAKSYSDTSIANLVGTAPEKLNTLEELATAIEENDTVVDALNSAIGSKANASDLAEVQMGLGKFDTSLSWNSDETVYTETWTYNGSNYRQVMTEISDTQWTKQLYVDDVLTGTWTLTIDETNMVANTVYAAS